ncbi:hypothetical protein FCJ61_03485 [Burkholderia metallica]|uniref:hypothetical protein n=1 Tax=Burkholderia metallica TaxID=488729 RepID=UPI00157B75B7|nr:hypothetical protein [Burkholderia metallica]NTZ82103.1 hypothetical protein [Burkholderia metallica]
MDEIIDVDSGMDKHPQRFQNTRLGVADACGRTPASPACDSASRSASHHAMARAHAGQPVSLAAEILAIARHAKRNPGQVAFAHGFMPGSGPSVNMSACANATSHRHGRTCRSSR